MRRSRIHAEGLLACRFVADMTQSCIGLDRCGLPHKIA